MSDWGDRSAYQLQIRVFGSARQGTYPAIHSDRIRGLENDEWAPGAVLTLTSDGQAATLDAPITSEATGPVKYLAMDDFAGAANAFVALHNVDADTYLVGQLDTGTADAETIGRRGVLIQDATTGNYAVQLTDTNPSVEVVDAEPNYDPYGVYATGARNLVVFKFLPAVLAIAPPAVAS